jgi:hypothetical protein
VRTMRKLCLVLVLAVGCHEAPPEIPPGYVGSAPPAFGWPAPVAYDLEPTHPLNRWFQRAFSRRTTEGDLEPAWSEDPLPLLEVDSAVDRAEIESLTRAILAERRAHPEASVRSVSGVARAEAAVSCSIFASDALQLALLTRHFGSTGGLSPLTSSLLEAAELPPDAEMVETAALLRGRLAPPPLREGAWVEVPGSGEGGHGPTSADARWTRVFRETGPAGAGAAPRSVLIWLRVALDRSRRPLPLAVPSECWELSRAEPAPTAPTVEREIEGDSDLEASDESDSPEDFDSGTFARIQDLPPARVWRFDRARWTVGADPWVRTRDGASVVVVDPQDPGARRLRGRLRTVCAACHAADPVRALPAGVLPGASLSSPAPEERLRAQLRALERTVFSVSADSTPSVSGSPRSAPPASGPPR